MKPVLIFGECFAEVDYLMREIRFFRAGEREGDRERVEATRRVALDCLRFLDVVHSGLLDLDERSHCYSWGVKR